MEAQVRRLFGEKLMNIDRESIIRMARDAGWPEETGNLLPDTGSMNLKRFAALVAAAEREAIMKICNRHTEPIAGVIYHAIRARSDR